MTETTTDVRKLVTLRTIDDITPIEGADAIETAHVGGWTVVGSKGDFAPGDTAVFFEIDAFLPETEPRFAPFIKRGVKKVEQEDGTVIVGHVLKSIRLRGQISQGLLMPLSDFPELTADSDYEDVKALFDTLGVFKYEPPIPASMGGQVIGSFPQHLIQKTDSERVQNLDDAFLARLNADDWFATEKLDGTSATFIQGEEGLRGFSRNLEVQLNLDAPGTVYDRIAAEWKLAENLPVGAILQGEIFGEGVQKNPLKLKGLRFMVFTEKNLDRDAVTAEFAEKLDAHTVPHLTQFTLPRTTEEAVRQADGLKSTLNPQVNAEGIVWWNRNGETFREVGHRANFKAINNKFLLKQK